MAWHTPLGYKVLNGKILVCDDARKIVERIFCDYHNGVSTNQIARTLKQNGIKNKNGKVSWSHVSIGKILENYNYLGTEYLPQIIETDLFERVQKKREQVRADGNRGIHRANRDKKLLFSGMITCSECGSCYKRVGQPYKKRPDLVPHWVCEKYIYRNAASCRNSHISDKQLESVCILALNRLIRNPKLISKFKQRESGISLDYYMIDQQLEDTEELDFDEIISLLYQRAEERYKTLKVRDENFQANRMTQLLDGMEELTEFNEELCRMLIRQIVVHKENLVEVIFQNKNKVRIEYGKIPK